MARIQTIKTFLHLLCSLWCDTLRHVVPIEVESALLSIHCWMHWQAGVGLLSLHLIAIAHLRRPNAPFTHPGCEAGWSRMAGSAPSGIIPWAPHREAGFDVRLYPWPSGLAKKNNFCSRCSRMSNTPETVVKLPWSHRNCPAAPSGDRVHPGIEISPVISQCIYGLLQEVSEYSRFLHGGDTDSTACSR